VNRILIVEDDEASKFLIRELLESVGYQTVTAGNGREALELLQSSRVSAIVTDLRMPVVNGLRLIRALRERGDTIPIVAISGVNADQLMLAEDYGANAGLTKPLDREEFLTVMRKVLSDTRDSWSDVWIHPEFGSVGDY
jgi:CheY-like chemotaxis protein